MSSEPKTGARSLRGGCLCGAVEYRVTDEFGYAMNCHCADCRRATGSAFKPFAGIERSKLQITKGGGQTFLFGDPQANHDVHCRVCGSFLFSVLNQGTRVHVTLGTLIDPPTIRPTAHIFVGDKAPWDRIADDLPRHDGHVA